MAKKKIEPKKTAFMDEINKTFGEGSIMTISCFSRVLISASTDALR